MFHAGIYNLCGLHYGIKDEVSYHLLHFMQNKCGPWTSGNLPIQSSMQISNTPALQDILLFSSDSKILLFMVN